MAAQALTRIWLAGSRSPGMVTVENSPGVGLAWRFFWAAGDDKRLVLMYTKGSLDEPCFGQHPMGLRHTPLPEGVISQHSPATVLRTDEYPPQGLWSTPVMKLAV